MSGNYLYDTDVIIQYLKGDIGAKKLIESDTGRQCISVITIAEIYSKVRGKNELEAIKSITEYFTIQDINAKIAEMAGLYQKKHGKKYALKLRNAMMAATAEYNSLELKTLDVEGYPMIKQIEIAYKK